MRPKDKLPCFIIAEAGVNHNGSMRIAKKLVDVAKYCGADAVKFQTFRAELLASKYSSKAEYQKKSCRNNETQLEMLRKLELTINDHKTLIKYCRNKKIGFLSSPFDLDSVDLLLKLGLKVFKVPSGEITNIPYLNKVGALKKKVIMSTGMAGLKEVKKALTILTAAGTKKKDITVLHCSTAYPAFAKDVNLKVMQEIKKKLKVNTGYSDHTMGLEISIAAVALGASVIEKHFTLDRNMRGPDHKASIEPDELKTMIRAIRNVEKALGSGVKKASPEEEKNKKVVRKSIVAKINIPKGTKIREHMIILKRPGTGIMPLFLGKVIGKKSRINIGKDRLIKFKDLI